MPAKRFNKKSGTEFRQERALKAERLNEILKKTPSLLTLFATSATSTETDDQILGSDPNEKDDDVGVNLETIEPQLSTSNRIAESTFVEKTTAELETETKFYDDGN